MRITLFGATGGTGRALVTQALERGHDVTAVVRSADGLPPQVRAIKADLEHTSVEAAVLGADAVLSALGPRTNAHAGIVTRATNLFVPAMLATGVRRLVVISAAPVPTVPSPARPGPPKHVPGDGLMMRTILTPIIRKAFYPTYLDLAEMEDVVRASTLDFTIVRPPRLVDKPLNAKYRTAIDRNLPGGRSVSRANLAHFMLAALALPETVGRAVHLAE
ncbi:NAD(P)-dependent oxidoreductase [Micromonosporaceae bacterium Da 78-11]